MPKNQLNDLQNFFKRYCNTLQVFGFNSARYDINFIKNYLLPILVNERDVEPNIIKKDNQFVSFKFGNVQLLDSSFFLGSAANLDKVWEQEKMQSFKDFLRWYNNKDVVPTLEPMQK